MKGASEQKSLEWKATWGALPGPRGTHFRLWAPEARTVTLVGSRGTLPLAGMEEGFFEGSSPDYRAGDLYSYRLDRNGPYPDPASRWQPYGVHGPSQIVDPGAFAWTDWRWEGLPWRDHVFYEVHTGTFTPEGTFEALRRKLPFLKELGVTALELMPVAEFPGSRNWGYDGVGLFAPARCYGKPDDLRLLADEAHRSGLAVFLDVVYNHFGPHGSYANVFSSFFFTDRHPSPWGAGINLDGAGSAQVREFFIENACHWIGEYHLDGLRLDATHALRDEGPRHFLADLTDRVRAAFPDRRVHVVAEDNRNWASLLRPTAEGGWGLDGVWSDELHHHLRRALAGDHEGYYADFSGKSDAIAQTLRQGWFFCGQRSAVFGEPRGSDPSGIPLERFIVCLQNHDQVGNRAFGERLHHQVALEAWRAASALLYFAPETPLLFMGQEWAASSPFLYFTDHVEELGRRITQGRRDEFKAFADFSDPARRDEIPDPQDPETFRRSRLHWEEIELSPHRETLEFTRALLGFRKEHLGGDAAAGWTFDARSTADGGLALRRGPYVALIRLCGKGEVAFEAEGAGSLPSLLLSSEEERFAPDGAAPALSRAGSLIRAGFSRPGAVFLDLGRPGD